MSLSPTEIFYVVIGLMTIAWTAWINRHLVNAGGTSSLESFYSGMELDALLLGWYYNFQYRRQYGTRRPAGGIGQRCCS